MLNYMTARRSINFISSRIRRGRRDITSSRQRQYVRNNQPEQTNQSDPINFELTKQLTQLTLLTNDDEKADGTSNIMVRRSRRSCVCGGSCDTVKSHDFAHTSQDIFLAIFQAEF